MFEIGFYFGLACLILFPFMMVFYVRYAKKQDHVPFHFRNCFPYEGFVDREKRQDVLGRVLETLVLIVSLVPAIYVLSAYITVNVNFKIYLIVFLIISVFAAAGFASISIVPLFKPRAHLILYFVYLAMMALKKTISGLTLLQLHQESGILASKIIAIVVFVTLITEVFLLVNPKLRTWDRLEKGVNKKGEEVLRRPKWFVLAYSEWAVFFVGCLVDILVTIAIYLAKEPGVVRP